MNKTQSNSEGTTAAAVAGTWSNGAIPANVKLGRGTLLTGELAFKRFHSIEPDALVIGQGCTMDDVHFDLGKNGRLSVGEFCYFTYAVLLCELEIRIGNYVVIGWNTTITDTDFHPVAPAERIADALACSPLGKGRARPSVLKRPVIIEDDVWIGPNATILKGVRIGTGSWIEAGSVVTRDVPPRSRIMGNPAQTIGEVA